MTLLESVKLYIGITESDRDDLLNEIINDTENQLKLRIGTDVIPSELSFIVKEIAIVRFNRIGSEGMEQETVDGHAVKYAKDDFAPYYDLLSRYVVVVPPDTTWQEGSVEFL